MEVQASDVVGQVQIMVLRNGQIGVNSSLPPAQTASVLEIARNVMLSQVPAQVVQETSGIIVARGPVGR